MTIGERLLNLRKEKNLSQEELANVLDVSRQTISKWETDQTTPDFDKIVPLCEYFGITSDELLSGKKDIIKAKEDNKKGKFARNIAVSVGLYILALVFIIFFAGFLDQGIIGTCLFFVTIAIATGIIIYSSIYYLDSNKKKKEKSKEDRTIKQLCDIVGLLAVIIYLFVSFTTGAWHITWIIFLIEGLFEAIIKLLFNLGKKDEVETKENENE